VAHAHSHPHSPARADAPRLAAVLGLSVVVFVLELAGGLASGSLALLADAGHVLADMAGMTLALVAIWIGSRPASRDRTFGYLRLEILAAVVNAGLLFAVAGFILYEAWRRLVHPEPVRPYVMLAIASVAICGNLVALQALRKTGGGGLNVRAAYLEVFADTLGSAGVFIAALIIIPTGWVAADPVLSGILGIAIVPRTIGLLKDALHVLLEGTPQGLDHGVIEGELKSVDGVAAVHDLHVWCLTSGVPVLTAHVVAGDGSCDDLLERVLARLRDAFAIEHATIQIEHSDRADSEHPRF